jgi:hypothetical protein
MGKGLFIKHGNGIVKVKQFGDGLYLRPYRAENITGDGLFIKQGGNYEPVNDVSIRDIPLLAAHRPLLRLIYYLINRIKCQYISSFINIHNLPQYLQ